MTSIKLKFRASTVEGRPGTLYYQLYRHRTTKRINTRMRIRPEQWNSEEERLAPEKDNLGILLHYQQIINRDLGILRNIIDRLEAFRQEYSLDDIIEQYCSRHSEISSLKYIRDDIQDLILNGKLGTARNRRRALSSFCSYLKGSDIPLSGWNRNLISGYAKWLEKKSLARNTVSFYMRNLRTVYNKAVKEGLIPQENPFSDVYTGIDSTRKRAVNESVLLKLMQLDLSTTPALELARDIFLFSYCTRGMTFVDIAYLSKKDIQGNYIIYRRKKTGQQLCVHIEACTRFILKKYSRNTSRYIFPLLRAENNADAYRQYQTALGYYNRNLKRLSRLLKLQTPISSYTARHTWATTARNRNTPLAVISTSMGHTSEMTTRIYLAAIDESVIDNANRNVLAPLNRMARGLAGR